MLNREKENMIISHLYQLNNGCWVVQSNDDHCNGVAELASQFADKFGMGNWGKMLGLLHDRGKESVDFQKHIKFTSGYDISERPIGDTSHSIIGAKVIDRVYRDNMCLLSNAIAGHHRGLYNIDELNNILKNAKVAQGINLDIPKLDLRANIQCECAEIHHLERMLFSCLVDADYLDTERFMSPENYNNRANTVTLSELKIRLDKFLQKFKNVSVTPLNELRTHIQEECAKKSVGKPGFYQLTVPTGGGKTIASVVWAINHAINNNLERIIIAIPYTSIIVQTAQVLRGIFCDENVLEHHSIVSDELDENNEYSVSKSKLAIQNWDAPIVVTTNVQLLESMFSNHPGKCRKLHSLVKSVIILDEVQTLPLTFLQPIVDAMKSYVKMFNCSFLFCTASQPILDEERKGCGTAKFNGITPQSICKIIENRENLHDKLRRVNIDIDVERKLTPSDIAQKLQGEERVLCVVNTRKIASEIYDCLSKEDYNFHLSRMMCPLHIRETIDKIKSILASDTKQNIRVVSTQLIEAGVDIDFPCVYRQLAGLDSILQAAGRCNREGKLDANTAVTHVFQVEDYIPRGYIKDATYAMQNMIDIHNDKDDVDWFSPEIMTEYYQRLYWKINSFPD